MSVTPTPPAPVAPPRPEGPGTVTVVSHSNLFYWWPVWAVGFLMAILTFIDSHRMVILPSNTDVYYDKDPKDNKDAKAIAAVSKDDKVLVVAEDKVNIFTEKPKFFRAGSEQDVRREGGGSEPVNPGEQVVIVPGKDPKPQVSAAKVDLHEQGLHAARSSKYGVIFCTVLLLVILITNVPLRGLWSVVIIVTVVLMSIIFALAGWWDYIFEKIRILDIRINAGGYVFVSSILFGIWLVTFLFFDRTMYIQFTPGQLKVCTEIGGGERVYDAAGMKLEKQRSDLFRHWILGLGSGDLIVRTSGAGNEHIDLPNVLFIGRTVARIEDMMKRKQVVAAR